MVKVQTLVPLQHPTTGEPLAAGVEVDVADEVARDWKADGKVAFSADVEAAAQQANEGHYNTRTGREDTPSGKAAADAEKTEAPSGKAAATEEEPPRKGKT